MTGNEKTGIGMALGMVGGAAIGLATGFMVALIPIGAVVGLLGASGWRAHE